MWLRQISEHAIRGTYCDLAVRIDGKLAFLLEVKAVGLDLKDQHVKQSVDYAANQGCEWVVLTNGIEWRRPLYSDSLNEDCSLPRPTRHVSTTRHLG